MYKLALLCLVFLCSFTLISEKDDTNIEDFLKEFVKQRECSKISLSGNLFSFKNKDEVESEVEIFQLYIFDKEDPLQKSDLKSIKKMIQKNDLELLNMIKSGDNLVEIYIKEKKDIIEDVFMTVASNDGGIIFHVAGKIQYSDLKNLNIDFDGAEELKKM